MKKNLALIFLLFSNIGFSQNKGVVINSETKERIPFVNIWVIDENNGTTTNESGEFELNVDHSKIVLFSAIGFKTKKCNSDSIASHVKLQPHVTELDEIVLNAKKSTQELSIGKFKKSTVHHSFACGTNPWIVARYFDYKEVYAETVFIKKIRVLTRSDVKNSKFNIRLYSVNENGEPENYIYDKNIFGVAKKGSNITEIDISDLNIVFPKEGFFIAIEWLILENNKYEYSYTKQGSKKKLQGISYEPALGTVPAETNENSWFFSKGKWRKAWTNSNNLISKSYQGKYDLLAIELILTN